MTEKVFLSYASKDRAFAESLKLKLNEFLPAQSQPLEVFDVQSNVTLGEDIRKAIKAAMDAASTVVIVSSPDGDASQWVNYEAGLADALGKKIVIVGRKGTGKSALFHHFIDSAKFIEVDDGG
jgi:ABC-type transport system involved in cytochrome bd biosynthesis fused ATPase/permease subunit